MFDPDASMGRIRAEVARRLLAAALALQAEARADVSRGNPAPHDNPAPKGEFPKLRTGGGRAAIAVTPASVAAVADRGSVGVGHRRTGAHLLYLSGKGWKGIGDSLQRARGRINALLRGGNGA